MTKESYEILYKKEYEMTTTKEPYGDLDYWMNFVTFDQYSWDYFFFEIYSSDS